MGEAAAATAGIGFGRTFAEHMAVARFDGEAWSPVELVPYDALTLSPAAMVFHYGQAVFEGLKAYRQPDGGVALFRPRDNAERFAASAIRMAMPVLPEDDFVDACVRITQASRDEVPSGPDESLYLRPTMIATEACLGVRPSSEYLFFVIASPSGAYFNDGVQPITVRVADDAVRAAPGGTGAAKCAGNYAASLGAKKEAIAAGCDEVLWLDAVERHWVEELSGMNVVAVTHDATVVSTNPSGTILDGITRRSLLQLAAHLGYEVSTRPLSIDEVCSGDVAELFACGTGAVVVPIGSVVRKDVAHPIGDSTEGPVTRRLREELVGIQAGRRPDPFNWTHPV